MIRLAALVLGLSLLAGQARGASPDPKDLAIPPEELSKARLLVRELGSTVFRDRERAQDELARMGRLARPALLEALRSELNPEIRTRVSRLLPKAEAADLQARIDTFLADTDGKFDHDLPAWGTFRKQLGPDRTVRQMYVEMLLSHPNRELLVALGGPAQEGGRAIADRRMDMYLDLNPGAFGNRIGGPRSAKARQPSLVDVALLLFAECLIPSGEIPRPGPFTFLSGATFIQQQAAMRAINDSANTPHAGPYRQILARWLDTRTAPEDLSNVIYVAQNLGGMKEATTLLRRAVSTDGVQGWAKGQALAYLVQRNGKDELPFVRTLLKDDTVVTPVFLGNNNMGQPIQASCLLQDVALATLLAHTGQDLRTYGFEFQPGANINPKQLGYGSYAFTSDEKRDAAMKMFADWEAKQKKDEPPPARK